MTFLATVVIAWTAFALVVAVALGSFVARSDRRERRAARDLDGEDRRAA